jgi:hypothetical protein
MKTITTLLLAAAVGLGVVGSAKAGEALLSPRAKANQITHVSGVNNDANLVSGWYAGAASRMYTTAPNMVAAGPVPDVNLVSGNYPGAAAKIPMTRPSYEIAPAVEKAAPIQK